MRRWLSPLLTLSFVAALSTEALLAPAAENFACGAGGTPDPKTSKCICPLGTMGKTAGGTSRCVDRPIAPKAPPTTSTTATTAPPVVVATAGTGPSASPTPAPTPPPPPEPTPTPTPEDVQLTAAPRPEEP
ncbi:MAG: hypothetical protein ABI175_16900, partial [Polyangiales bacterium]